VDLLPASRAFFFDLLDPIVPDRGLIVNLANGGNSRLNQIPSPVPFWLT